jgi:MFS family permease
LRHNRSFRLLWFGQVVSQMGDWFDTIAVYTIALRLTGSSRSVALIMVARFLPTVVLGPGAGVVADRFSRRSIMISADIMRAVVVLGFLFVRRADQMWLVYLLTVLQLSFSTFFEPAKTAVIPSIVSDRELVPANAIAAVTWSVMLTLGAAVGGFVAGLFVKPAWGMGGGILTLLAVFGERIYPIAGKAATGIGVLFTARGIGTAIGPFIARRWSGETRSQMQTAIGIGFLMGGAFYFGFGVSRSFILALVFLAVAHMGGSILWVFSTVLLQRATDDQFRGRVFAAELGLATLTMATSNYLVGELMDRFGFSPRVVTASIGLFFMMPGIIWFVTKSWWDRKEKFPITTETKSIPTNEVAAAVETEHFEI